MDYVILLNVAIVAIVAAYLNFRIHEFTEEFRKTIRGLGDEAAQRRMVALEIECKNANESRAELGAAIISMLERHPELPNDEDVKRLKDLVHFVD